MAGIESPGRSDPEALRLRIVPLHLRDGAGRLGQAPASRELDLDVAQRHALDRMRIQAKDQDPLPVRDVLRDDVADGHAPDHADRGVLGPAHPGPEPQE